MLHRIAYNLLRCKADAEDVVQETFIKWLSIDHDKIENTKAYLIKAVTNNCLNHIQSLKKKKEEYWDSIQLSELFVKVKESDFAHIDLVKELSAAFAKAQITEIEAAGRKLDPHRHQAMAMVDSPEPANTVVQVFQKGYLLNDRIMRPAMVAVAKPGETSA